MTLAPSQTLSEAFRNLVGPVNDAAFTGSVVAIRGDGWLEVALEGGTTKLAWSVIDHVFSVGEVVTLAKTDEDHERVIGVDAPRVDTRPTTSPAAASDPTESTPASASAPYGSGADAGGPTSSTLREAVRRFVLTQNQILKGGTILAVLDDGGLVVRMRAGDLLVRKAATNQEFAVGQTVYSVRGPAGTWYAMGTD